MKKPDGENSKLYLIRNEVDVEHRRHLAKVKRNRRAGYTSLALAGVTGMSWFAVQVNTSLEDSRRQSMVSMATDPGYNDVDVLRQTGTCADELIGEAELRLVAAGNVRNESNRNNFLAAAERFERSAELASEYDTPCIPQESQQGGLTPNFDVAILVEQAICAAELEANPAIDPSVARSEFNQNTLDIKREIWQTNIKLAEKHDVSC